MELSSGVSLGPYRLVERVGLGGMAEVWRAYQPSLERHVAIKILPRHFAAQPGFVERFRREALAISRLEHPNILPVFDFGEQDGFTYMVNPFISGGTLAQRLGRAWSVTETLQLIQPLASALDYAHSRGVIHRDVKPSNVLLTEQGRVVLGDFGVARMLEAAGELTQAGTAVGTPQYMAPEQAAGQGVGPASDFYSLGVVTYELLAGRVPFQAETPLAVALAHLHRPLPSARTLNPRLSDEVDAVLARAMAKDPSERFPTAVDFVSALASAEPAKVGGQLVGDVAEDGEAQTLPVTPAQVASSGSDDPDKTLAIPPPPSARADSASLPSPDTVVQPRPRAVAPAPPPSSASRRSYTGLLALAVLAAVVFAAATLGSRLLSSSEQPAQATRLAAASPTAQPSATPPAAAARPAATPTATAAPIVAPTATPAPPTPTNPPPPTPTAPPASAAEPAQVAAQPATKPAPSGLEAVLQADRARVSSLGFRPDQHAVTPYGSENLIAIKGACADRPQGCQQVFFFVGSRYLGTDTLKTSTAIGEVAAAGPGRIQVAYPRPGLPPVTITYTWNGQRLTPDATPPGH